MHRNCGAASDPSPPDVESAAGPLTVAMAAVACECKVVGTKRSSGAPMQAGTSPPRPE